MKSRRKKEPNLNVGETSYFKNVPLSLVIHGAAYEDDRRRAYAQLMALTKHSEKDELLKHLSVVRDFAGEGYDGYTFDILNALIQAIESGYDVEDLKKLERQIHKKVRQAERGLADGSRRLWIYGLDQWKEADEPKSRKKKS